jgi:hypothetical protein
MPFRRRRPSAALLAAWVVGVSACRPSPVQPRIEFSVVPPADVGGPEKLAPVAGRVNGARPDQRIVLMARSGGVWYVQPFRSWPFTTIEKDGTWKNRIHLGTEYTALLVGPDYKPSSTAESVPSPGGSVAAVLTVKGSGPFVVPSARTVTFSGYEWEIRQLSTDRHTRPVEYDVGNASVDGEGHLHLALTHRNGRWAAGEVALTRPLGPGTYQFDVRSLAALDPAAAFEVWTWDPMRADQNWAELGFDVRQAKAADEKNAEFVVQPSYVASNVFRFAAPSSPLSFSMRWLPGAVAFQAVRGTGTTDGAAPLVRREFTSGVPVVGAATIHIGILHLQDSPVLPTREGEVVVERFVFLP